MHDEHIEWERAHKKRVGITMNCYRYPEYYQLAFSFRNIRREVGFLERAIRRFSGVRVRRVIEFACGPAPYLEEWDRRGYRYTGLDLTPAMCHYARRQAAAKQIDATIHHGDLRDFGRHIGRFEFAYVLLGSVYVRSNAEFLHHLACVARVLPSGALYALEGVIWFNLGSDKRQTWVVRRGDVTVLATYAPELIDLSTQNYDERLTLVVNDHGRRRVISGRTRSKIVFPQEFLALVGLSGHFEFVGWFNNFRFSEKITPEGRQIAILRKR